MAMGYIKIHRKIWKSDLWKLDAKSLKLAVHCILKARHEDGEWFDGRTKKYVLLKRGEFISSTRQLAEEVNDSVVGTQKRIGFLKKIGFLRRYPERSFSKFLVINYHKYNPEYEHKGEHE